MIDHPPHVAYAKTALAYFDDAPTGAEIGRRAVLVASAMRVLLYEPSDGYQGEDFRARAREMEGPT